MNKFFISILLGLSGVAFGQHQNHEGMPMTATEKAKSKADTSKSMDTTMGMTHSLSRNLPMNRNGSGTSWHPDNTPMYAYMSRPSPKGWSYMLHYSIYLRYTSQNATNADKQGYGQQLGAPNWFMGMAQRRQGNGDFFRYGLCFHSIH